MAALLWPHKNSGLDFSKPPFHRRMETCCWTTAFFLCRRPADYYYWNYKFAQTYAIIYSDRKGVNPMAKVNSIRYLYDADSNLELIFCDNSTISYPLHNHSSVYTIGVVLEGSIILNTNYTAHVYGKSQTFVIPPYVPHSVKGNAAYSLLSLCICKSVFSSPDFDIDKVMTAITNLLVETLDSDQISQELILCLLSCLHYLNGLSLISASSNDMCIDKLKRQLELFPEIKLSVEEMAHVALTSKYYFIRRFKQIVGLTPHQFQMQNRIRKAQRLICKTDTITEVALTTGFCDQSHFIKQFEKLVGLTPSTYKLSAGIYKSNVNG